MPHTPTSQSDIIYTSLELGAHPPPSAKTNEGGSARPSVLKGLKKQLLRKSSNTQLYQKWKY